MSNRKIRDNNVGNDHQIRIKTIVLLNPFEQKMRNKVQYLFNLLITLPNYLYQNQAKNKMNITENEVEDGIYSNVQRDFNFT